MAHSEKNQHAIRRSTRLSLEIPVQITSLEARVPYSEQANTTLVNAHGCGVIAQKAITQGIRVRLEILSAKRQTTARVAEVVPLGGDPETWLVGLELDVPGNFWGIEYAPSDWKVEETAAATVADRPAAPEADEAKPIRSRRWRLADISAGACYLETAAPFPVNTPVLLSVRVKDSECLLDGMVRASFPESGMAVEFTGGTSAERQSKVETLIGRLVEAQEAPKIFVGRKEGVRSDNSTPPPGAAKDSEMADELLQLVLRGGSLTSGQFHDELRTQRLGKRQETRFDVAVPVLLSGVDATGRPLGQQVMTVNVSSRGAKLAGVHGVLRPGDTISLERHKQREDFRVVWVGPPGSPASGEVSVITVAENTAFWNDVLEAAALEPGTKDGEA